MIDLVKRLRDYINCRPWAEGRTFDATHPEVLIAQSADRIETLEAALQYVDDNMVGDDCGNWQMLPDFRYGVIRAALGEKKDE